MDHIPSACQVRSRWSASRPYREQDVPPSTRPRGPRTLVTTPQMPPLISAGIYLSNSIGTHQPPTRCQPRHRLELDTSSSLSSEGRPAVTRRNAPDSAHQAGLVQQRLALHWRSESENDQRAPAPPPLVICCPVRTRSRMCRCAVPPGPATRVGAIRRLASHGWIGFGSPILSIRRLL